ncbi:MAG: magnesium/cobalt transporter CorA [Geobacter sp.]|nr:magnesium/cobalt transporter CorA [Geobacter sp.]
MKKILKKRGKKAGLSPGSLVHIGEATGKAAAIEVVEYDQAKLVSLRIDSKETQLAIRKVPSVTWINVSGISDIALMQRLGESFSLHPLVLEDIVNTDQRPKVEDNGSYIFLVLKFISPTSSAVATEQISILFGENWLISFQEGLDGDPFAVIRERLKNEQGRLRSSGADYLAYALMDVIVDNYFLVLEEIADRIEDLEEELMGTPTPQTLAGIYRLKRELLLLHRSVWPLREVVSSLIRRDSPLVGEFSVTYLRDLYDHTIQVVETTETLRDMLSGMLDIYLSTVSNRMNGIMKVLTIIATIFMPLTFIAGLYGMNFKHMPELELEWGYPAVLIFMLLIVIGMCIFIRRKRWL